MPRKKIVATGCPRSGTTYMATALSLHGLDVKHEELGSDGVSSWAWAGKDLDKIESAKSFRRENAVVIHNVRSPLPAISSLMTLSTKSWPWAEDHISIPSARDKIVRVMAFWVNWNKLAESMADLSFMLEDFSIGGEAYFGVCKVCGIEPRPEIVKGIPQNLNAREHRDLTWNQLYRTSASWCRKVKKLAKHYGYPAR